MEQVMYCVSIPDQCAKEFRNNSATKIKRTVDQNIEIIVVSTTLSLFFSEL